VAERILRRAPRLMPVVAPEPGVFAAPNPQQEDVLAQMAVLSGVDQNNPTAIASFLKGLSNTVYSTYMNEASA
jgi:hypothetical protein